MEQKYKGLFRLSAWLVILFVVMQLTFLAINAHVSGVDTAMFSELKTHLPVFIGFLTPAKFHLIYPLVKFVCLLLLVFYLFAYLLWYVAVSVSEAFHFTPDHARYLMYCIWLVAVVLILCGNAYYVPHSWFATLIQTDLLADRATQNQLALVFYLLLAIIGMLMVIAMLNAVRRLLTGVMQIRDGVVAILIAGVIYLSMPAGNTPTAISTASSTKPNVIILGFDALRPDYLSFYNSKRTATPQFDYFLQKSVVFTEAYTPDARTFPSWMSILTAQYPLQHKGREDNIDLGTLHYTTTLALELQNQGYETIFASDDNRFNNINQTVFGFKRMIGPSGTSIDMIVSGMNDIPLTNLLMTTRAGKKLFADYIGNHGTPHLYEPRDFLQQFAAELAKRDLSKPVFLAAHFNITAWPFYYLNQSLKSTDTLSLYKQSIQAGDQQFADIISILQAQNLLTNTIFILISDHGITMQMPNDRVITESLYQGNKDKIFVKRTAYRNVNFAINTATANDDQGESKVATVTSKMDLTDPVAQQRLINELQSPYHPERFGLDTSWGYGNDLLSLKQNRALVAIQFFNLAKAVPHRVDGRITLLDIAPTVLDLLEMPPMQATTGTSLKLPIIHLNVTPKQDQPIFLESSFTIPEIEQGDINVDKVLLKTMKFYRVNADNALLSILPAAEKISIANKQRAILYGDWMLAFYPESVRQKINPQTGQLDNYVLPAYSVLVNLKSHAWTTNLQQPLASSAPVAALLRQMKLFYGDEMAVYGSNNQSTNK